MQLLTDNPLPQFPCVFCLPVETLWIPLSMGPRGNDGRLAVPALLRNTLEGRSPNDMVLLR